VSEASSLYRRHRPQSFEEVVGQEHVVRTLRGAIEQGKVHHAYLFVGSRGTGKTSMAKILARSLNCVNGPTVTPCGECESCRSIAAGSSLDVLEMDAASNRSVDDIRDLRERVGYAPTAGHWKVYILDEAHMLTKEAWNAFLKTLEEPPPNTVFVLATTEAHKVMATIVDRCQRFDFERPSLEQIAVVIRRVATAESIELDDATVAMIARAAGGSFRDALGTLDQLVAYGGPQVSLDDVLATLGVADADLLFAAGDAIADRDPRAALAVSEGLMASGRDVAQFARDLLAHLRQLLVVRTIGAIPESFSVTSGHDERLHAQAGRLGDAAALRAIDALAATLAAIREGDDARMTLEVALLRSANPALDSSYEALLARIERLEGGLGKPASVPAAKVEVEKPASAPPAKIEPVSAPPAAEIEEPAVAVASGDVDLENVTRLWPAILDHVRQSGEEVLAAVFEAARPIEIDGSTLKIGFPASAQFNKRKAESKANQARLAEAVEKVTGAQLRPAYVVLDAQDASEPGDALGEEEVFEHLKASFEAEEVDSEIERVKRAEEAS
jgi:DNA polymerase III subunit gamma/tau